MASSTHPDPYIITPTSEHTQTIITLHGTSQNGPSFAAPLLSFPIPSLTPATNGTPKTLPELFPNTKFIFPIGASKPTTVFAGTLSNAWFDVHSFADRTLGEADAIPGLRESITYISALVAHETLVVGRGHVILMGFSQGCALAAMFVLSGEAARAGVRAVVGMSGYLPFRRQIAEVKGVWREVVSFVRELLGLEAGVEGLDESLVMFLTHGDADVKMKKLWGDEMRNVLEALEIDIRWTSYPGLGHWWNEQEMRDVAVFLRGIDKEKEFKST